jgi:succinate dehydrogenase / fumarate reductase cytochrome b subunit
MSWLLRFYQSTLGMKVVMAITGVILYGFVAVHMVGNLQVFLGADELNGYGALLHRFAEVLWGARITLLTAVLLHIVSSMRLIMLSAQARPIGYQKKVNTAVTFASISMRFTALVVLVFIPLHLLHFTVGWSAINPTFQEHVVDGVHAPAVFHNVTTAFANPLVVGLYIVSQLCLGVHLYHGGVSFFRTLGLQGERQMELGRLVSRLVTLTIVLGNVLIPIGVFLGLYPKG